MTRRTLAAAALVAASVAALAADPPAPPKSKTAQLVANLGSPEFAVREAATGQLETLGAAALTELRAGVASPDPEVARRARDLVAAIGYRLENEKILAPTLVDLTAEDEPLDDVLADLSKQTRNPSVAHCPVYYVVLNWPARTEPADRAEFAAKKISVKTGKVPFWTALQKVCDAAELQIGSVAGVTAPGSASYSFAVPGRMPNAGSFVPPPQPPGAFVPPGRANPPYRSVTDPRAAIVLEPRSGAKKRPGVVFGAVCVEAVALSQDAIAGVPDTAVALLQAWVEPRLLQWREVRGVKVVRAADDRDQVLAHVYDPPYNPQQQRGGGGGGMRAWRAPNGQVVMVNDDQDAPKPPFPRFTPNNRQAAVKFKPGAAPPAGLKAFTGSLLAAVWSTVAEPVAAAELVAGQQVVAATQVSGLTLKATYFAGDAETQPRVDVDLTYDSNTLRFARENDELSGVPLVPGKFNGVVGGVRVTDADGAAFSLRTDGITHRMTPNGMPGGYTLRMVLSAGDEVKGPPRAVTLWGTYAKVVEIPFDLKDVPLTVSKK